ncbi:MAG: Rpn family recombination-promoting nuclease/putative transposase [Dysgonamonadaceae bacterium]|jgi:predicted transposase/invertase (TIGR01784 family)|nr:Rpn family recombination-promoting nuclease/putative transposase [Dysgonamonadaceae bacterium]
MARYLDPKNDMTFKRIFGEHPRLLISFLNALMPLAPGRRIESLTYLSPEQVPDSPLGKDSIVDVKCVDSLGRQFIVEMQMYWSEIFKSRMVFNASKAYVRQLGKGGNYRLLQPVYGLGIINDAFDRHTEEFYHHYQTINRYNTDEVIEGLEFVLIELEKFNPEKWADRKMAVLWLRFLREIEDQTRKVPEGLLESEEIREALELCEEGAFTPEEMEAYDRHWDRISTEKGLNDQARAEGLAKGLAEGEAKGRAEGRAEGEAKGLAEGEAKGRVKELERIILTAHQNKLSIQQIQAFSGLSEDAVREILKRCAT